MDTLNTKSKKIKFLLYVFLILFVGMFANINVSADNCDKYQCITCEAKDINGCDIKYKIIADGKGSAKVEFDYKINPKETRVGCKVTEISLPVNFISGNSKLICPSKFYYKPSYTNKGSAFTYLVDISIEKKDKYNSIGEFKETSNNQKPFKDTSTNNNSKVKSCKYKHKNIDIGVTYNNGKLSYTFSDGYELNTLSDLTPDMFEKDNGDEIYDGCPEIYISCGSHGENKICTLKKKGLNGNGGGHYGETSQNADELEGNNNNNNNNNNTSQNSGTIDVETGDNYECSDLESTKTYKYIKDLFFLIQIIVPIILLVLGSLDFIKAIAAQSDDDMKKAQSSFVKRLIIAVIIFIMPAVLGLLFSFLTSAFDITTCGVGTEETQNN